MRVHVRVVGRVQGVGYRYHASRQAVRLGLTGWVQNVSDGSVEAEFQGPKESVDGMVDWCRGGPVVAQVFSVALEERAEIEAETTFRVRG